MRRDYVLDSGPFGMLAGGDERVEALIDEVHRRAGRVFVPSVVLAECCGDFRYDVKYDRVLKGLGGAAECVVPIDAAIARRAGGILRRSGMRETLDGIVVAVAESFGTATNVITADKRHMTSLVASATVFLEVVAMG